MPSVRYFVSPHYPTANSVVANSNQAYNMSTTGSSSSAGAAGRSSNTTSTTSYAIMNTSTSRNRGSDHHHHPTSSIHLAEDVVVHYDNANEKKENLKSQENNKKKQHVDHREEQDEQAQHQEKKIDHRSHPHQYYSYERNQQEQENLGIVVVGDNRSPPRPMLAAVRPPPAAAGGAKTTTTMTTPYLTGTSSIPFEWNHSSYHSQLIGPATVLTNNNDWRCMNSIERAQIRQKELAIDPSSYYHYYSQQNQQESYQRQQHAGGVLIASTNDENSTPYYYFLDGNAMNRGAYSFFSAHCTNKDEPVNPFGLSSMEQGFLASNSQKQEGHLSYDHPASPSASNSAVPSNLPSFSSSNKTLVLGNDTGGDADVKGHQKTNKKDSLKNTCTEDDREKNDESRSLEPNDYDIISGRGNGVNRRPGNTRFREIVSKYKETYSYAKSTDKREIAKAVIREVEMLTPPSRFLVQNGSTKLWHVLNRHSVIKKVAQALREPDYSKKISKIKKRCILEHKFGKTVNDLQKRKVGMESVLGSGSDEATWRGQDIAMPSTSSTTSGFGLTARNSNGVVSLKTDEQQKLLQPPVVQIASGLGTCNQGDQQRFAREIGLHGTPIEQATTCLVSPLNAYPTQHTSRNDKLVAAATNSANLSGEQISLSYVMNYQNMTIRSTVLPSTNQVSTKACNFETNRSSSQVFEDIVVIASTCKELTALFLIVRTGCLAFSSIVDSPNLHAKIKPNRYDVLVNATDIKDHPGNLRLAEHIQRYYIDYRTAESNCGSQELIVKEVLKSLSNENVNTSPINRSSNDDDGQNLRTRFLMVSSDVEEEHCNRKYSSTTWILLSRNDVNTMIKSLLRQAASFILHPDLHDVLFDRQDVSSLGPGNIYFNSIISNFREPYTQSSPEIQLQLAAEIVGIMTARHSRFLGDVEGTGMWMPLTFQNAIHKTRELLANPD